MLHDVPISKGYSGESAEEKHLLVTKLCGGNDAAVWNPTKDTVILNPSFTAIPLASKVCPVCNAFSSTSHTTLNAHVDQCLAEAVTELSKVDEAKERKIRSMADIYTTAPCCTLEDLDRRNGLIKDSVSSEEAGTAKRKRSWQGPSDDLYDQEGNEYSANNVDSSQEKVRIWSRFDDTPSPKRLMIDGRFSDSSKSLGFLQGCSKYLEQNVENAHEAHQVNQLEKKKDKSKLLQFQEPSSSPISETLKQWVGSKRTAFLRKPNKKLFMGNNTWSDSNSFIFGISVSTRASNAKDTASTDEEAVENHIGHDRLLATRSSLQSDASPPRNNGFRTRIPIQEDELCLLSLAGKVVEGCCENSRASKVQSDPDQNKLTDAPLAVVSVTSEYHSLKPVAISKSSDLSPKAPDKYNSTEDFIKVLDDLPVCCSKEGNVSAAQQELLLLSTALMSLKEDNLTSIMCNNGPEVTNSHDTCPRYSCVDSPTIQLPMSSISLKSSLHSPRLFPSSGDFNLVSSSPSQSSKDLMVVNADKNHEFMRLQRVSVSSPTGHSNSNIVPTLGLPTVTVLNQDTSSFYNQSTISPTIYSQDAHNLPPNLITEPALRQQSRSESNPNTRPSPMSTRLNPPFGFPSNIDRTARTTSEVPNSPFGFGYSIERRASTTSITRPSSSPFGFGYSIERAALQYQSQNPVATYTLAPIGCEIEAYPRSKTVTLGGILPPITSTFDAMQVEIETFSGYSSQISDLREQMTSSREKPSFFMPCSWATAVSTKRGGDVSEFSGIISHNPSLVSTPLPPSKFGIL